MPGIIVTAGAARGLECCHQFLTEAGPRVMMRAAEAIERQLELLETAPKLAARWKISPSCSLPLGIPGTWPVPLCAGGDYGLHSGLPAPERGGVLEAAYHSRCRRERARRAEYGRVFVATDFAAGRFYRMQLKPGSDRPAHPR